VKEVPVRPLAMVATVCKLFVAPFFRVMVTGPSASAQVISKGLPARRVPKASSVKETF